MPTFEWLGRFRADFDRLSPAQQAAFLADLAEDRPLRKGLRVKGVQGAKGIFEMTWAPDGRATFEYGDEAVEGEAHVMWRRIGTHAIFSRP